MNITQWVVGVAVLIVLGGGAYVFSMHHPDESMQDTSVGKTMEGDVQEEGTVMDKDNDEAMMQQETMTDTGAPVMKKEDGARMEKVGSYEAYAADKIARANDGKVVLFFRASWCPTCRTLDTDIKSHLKEIPANVTILDVNYDSEKVLEQKYGVTYQHTLVQVDAQGTLVKKWSGSPTLADVVTHIQ